MDNEITFVPRREDLDARSGRGEIELDYPIRFRNRFFPLDFGKKEGRRKWDVNGTYGEFIRVSLLFIGN